jgi:hypothetical protein
VTIATLRRLTVATAETIIHYGNQVITMATTPKMSGFISGRRSLFGDVIARAVAQRKENKN